MQRDCIEEALRAFIRWRPEPIAGPSAGHTAYQQSMLETTGRIVHYSLRVGTLTVSVLCLHPNHSFLISGCLLDQSKTLKVLSGPCCWSTSPYLFFFFQANWICSSELQREIQMNYSSVYFSSTDSVMSVVLLFVWMWTNFTTWQHSWSETSVRLPAGTLTSLRVLLMKLVRSSLV